MSLLLGVLRDPRVITQWTLPQWNRLLRETRAQGLSARLSWILEERDLQAACPPAALTELEAQRCIAALKQAQARLELRKLHKALAPLDIPIMLLKGAAYAQAGLRVARGRDFADLDILLPRERLEAAETALETAGWISETTNRYDQRYYRRWMHELPPLHHRTRSFEVDVHHALLPLTGRLRPDPSRIWAASRSLPDAPYRIPCPEDMLLHGAAQVFQDGEIAGQLGGLLDLHQLIGELSAQSGFWERLPVRAEALQLGRPLYYALHFSRALLDTRIPPEVLRAAQAHAPGPLNNRLMDLLVPRVLEPRYPARRPARFAAWLLYLRSHWLRMPPGLLTRHLLRKALRGGKP
ncbi:MAG: nucleotidyltransferase family protein [Thiohalocapsa sp.]|jgi:hypothetical protein|uniref:nucleotidyltransferase domain-containing protein n=1 Tax=Thiohalocapsa sp. TaxID=2497641 RepID=UPI0025EA3164|nr:nucleotidyltransferase family protein [Thiohalocapsa sp.]MCG6942227.1 nucleotidyltransferase family protein [Thiohalocapsa sp.]